MKKYLLPADFSKVSANSLRFTLDMISENDQIKIFHVHTGLLNVSGAPIIKNLQTYEQNLKEELRKYLCVEGQMSEFPENCEIQIDSGEIVSTIISYAKTHSFDLIIMGTRDKYDLLDKWLGTVSLGVVKRSPVSVMLIPPQARFKGFHKTIVAGDEHIRNPDILDAIEKWNQELHSYLHFVHVQESKIDKYNKTSEVIVRKYYEDKEVDFSFDISLKKGKDVVKLLLKDADKESADLLLIIPDKQSYISALLFSSISKGLILNSETPLFFLKLNMA